MIYTNEVNELTMVKRYMAYFRHLGVNLKKVKQVVLGEMGLVKDDNGKITYGTNKSLIMAVKQMWREYSQKGDGISKYLSNEYYNLYPNCLTKQRG